MRRFSKRWVWTVSFVAWAALVTVGLAGITRYAATPGPPAEPRGDWPRDVPFYPTDRDVTLVLSIHPQCPCSRATIAELAKLMTRHPRRISAYVLLTRPTGAPSDWERGRIFAAAKQIPLVRVMMDQDGAWSQKFGAATSGQTFAFDATGRLRFSGGITASRGHEGDNAGSEAIAAILAGSNAERDRTPGSAPVFGCPLVISDCDECVRNE